MTGLVMWWIGSAASVVLVVAALASQSGTCDDSADAAASSCRGGGSGGLLLLGLAAMTLSGWMLRRTDPHSRSQRTAKMAQLRAKAISGGMPG